MPNESDMVYVRMLHMRRHAKEIFFNAMQQGYVSDVPHGTIPQIPGSRTIEYRHDQWRVLDTYLVAPQSPYSGGTTIIYYGNIPMWMMQYAGHYDEVAIPCLKAALKANYDECIFHGGRGPEFFEHKGLHYVNFPVSNNFHGRTHGHEAIFDASKNLVGMHTYQAWWMVPE